VTTGTVSGVRIRPLTSSDDLQQCVEFQQAIWGPDYADVVPAPILWVATRTGGIVAGAFDADGRLAGFVFGLTGFRDGEPLHWSDMLAVRPDLRGQGIGIALKRYQREWLLGSGIRLVSWTFDPLESRNAYLNFARLGATAREYIVDCYGGSSSPLHEGLPTDRLVTRWVLDSPRVRSRMEEGRSHAAEAAAGMPVVNPDGAEPDLELDAGAVRLQVPAQIQALKAADPRAALRWRLTTRVAFQTYLARGYEVVDVVREGDALSSYVLAAAW
jgi:predicted GNAT superfamily acetyltransferase